ncbi:MAG: hypothetical protein IKY59_05690, partial [Oscillospiraceae bacterium]|nr:hypothetical protein [Oscillospiraceae bacterium]
QVMQSQANDKVETGLQTNEAANNALKEALTNSGMSADEAAAAVEKAQTTVLVELKDVVLDENNNPTKVTFDVEPVLMYKGQQVKIEVSEKITFHLPVPSYMAAGITVKVRHDQDVLGFYVVKTDGRGHNYVEVESNQFSPYSVELTDAAASVGTKEFTDLKSALDEAAVNGGVVKLQKSLNLGSQMVILSDNVTLDLNGKTLTTTGYVMAVFANSYIVDNSAEKTGLLAVDLAKVRLLNQNKQLPVETDDGIMFVNVALEGRWSTKDNCFKFWFANETDQAFVDALVADYAGTNVQLQVELTWGGTNTMVYVFDANSKAVGDYLSGWQTKALTLSVKGAQSVNGLTFTAKLIFAENTEAKVYVKGAAVAYGAQA